MIGIILQDLIQAGFDPAKEFAARMTRNVNLEPEIYRKYTKAYMKMLESWRKLKGGVKFGKPNLLYGFEEEFPAT